MCDEVVSWNVIFRRVTICITGIVSEQKYLSKPYLYERSLSIVQFSLV